MGIYGTYSDLVRRQPTDLSTEIVGILSQSRNVL